MPNRSSEEGKLRGNGDKFHDISAIDSRLADLEQEKQQLIALRAEQS